MIKKELIFEDLFLKIETEVVDDPLTMLFKIYHTDFPEEIVADGKMTWEGLITLSMYHMYIGDMEYMINFTKVINELYKYAQSIGFQYIEVNNKLDSL